MENIPLFTKNSTNRHSTNLTCNFEVDVLTLHIRLDIRLTNKNVLTQIYQTKSVLTFVSSAIGMKYSTEARDFETQNTNLHTHSPTHESRETF